MKIFPIYNLFQCCARAIDFRFQLLSKFPASFQFEHFHQEQKRQIFCILQESWKRSDFHSKKNPNKVLQIEFHTYNAIRISWTDVVIHDRMKCSEPMPWIWLKLACTLFVVVVVSAFNVHTSRLAIARRFIVVNYRVVYVCSISFYFCFGFVLVHDLYAILKNKKKLFYWIMYEMIIAKQSRNWHGLRLCWGAQIAIISITGDFRFPPEE